MPVYEYVAINTNGKQIKGTVDAESIRAARLKLRQQNVFPTEMKEARDSGKSKRTDVKLIFKSDRVPLKKLAVATRLLATLSGAGLPLVAALQALSEQVDGAELKRIVLDVRERVEQGTSLAKALGNYPKVFPRLYVNMVHSGEASGTLDGVLMNLAEYYEAQIELRRKVSSALFYPILMLGFCCLVIIALVTFVVPSIVDIFIKQKVKLPLPTQAVIALSNFFTGYWWLIIAVIVGGVTGLRQYYKTPKGRSKVDEYLLRAPLFGTIYRKVTTARIATTLGTLLGNGVELLTALDIVRNIVGNVHMAKALEDARDGVREGQSLAKELSKSGYFPNLLSQMIAIGERSGKLEEMLAKAGHSFTTEANATITGLTTLIEPLMIMVLGVIVFGIVIAVLLPMTELMKIVQPGH